MRVVTSAPAKVILLGEHSVNRGQSALAVSVGLRVRCTVETGAERFTFASGDQTQGATRTLLVQLAARVDGWRDAQHYEAITLDELQAADIRAGDIVILWEGRDGQYRTPASHQRPYVAADAAAYLALEKKIKADSGDSD